MSQLFSIVTICLNEVKNIEATLKSIRSQTYHNFEWIVIDGGSTDGTYDILLSYQNDMSVLISEKDSGIYNAMNKGLKHTTGEYVLFLNGGDFFRDSEVLQRVSLQLGTADIVHGGIICSDKGNERIIRDPNPITKKYLLNNTIKHPATFVRKSLFERVGSFEECYKVAGDYDFFLRAVLKHNATTKYIDEIITVFNLDGVARNNPELREREKRIAQKRNISVFRRLKINCEYQISQKLNAVKKFR